MADVTWYIFHYFLCREWHYLYCCFSELIRLAAPTTSLALAYVLSTVLA